MSSSDVVCDCTSCPCGAPKRFKLTISGVTGCGYYPCDECPDLDGTYILEQQTGPNEKCRWQYQSHQTTDPCNFYNVWELGIDQETDCTLKMRVRYYVKSQEWVKTGILHCWEPQYVLTGGGQCFPDGSVPSCQFPDSITIEPIGLHSLEGTECIVCESCQKSPKVALPEVRPPQCRLDMHCGCARCAEEAARRLGLPNVTGGCGCAEHCAPAVNLNNGNLSVRLGMPDAGTLAPADLLTFNSRWGGNSPWGWGVQSQYAARVEAKGDCAAALFRCDGSKYCYAAKDPANGIYRFIPPGAPSQLQRTADGWVETELPPNGNVYRYGTAGQLLSIQAPGGQTWTATYSSPLSSILDPAGRLTTYSYTNYRVVSCFPALIFTPPRVAAV